MLTPVIDHPWDPEPREAIALQRRLAERVILRDDLPGPPRTIAGIDVGLPRGAGVARAAVVVLALDGLETIEQAVAQEPVRYPYIPGLLSFREAPAILAALARLTTEPDILMFDGQGYAHPRRMGIATHLGLVLVRPAVGCAKSRLYGSGPEPPEERGGVALLRHGEEVVGAALRTGTRVKPVYVSVGHRLSLDTAIALVLGTGAGYRLPEPTRRAHQLASASR